MECSMLSMCRLAADGRRLGVARLERGSDSAMVVDRVGHDPRDLRTVLLVAEQCIEVVRPEELIEHLAVQLDQQPVAAV